MEDIDRLFQEARSIPVSTLRGTRVFTIGGPFYGLSTCSFRRLLRRAGARIEPRARRSTDLIVVGDAPSRSSIIAILLTLSEKSRPPFVHQGPFLPRFFGELRDLEASRNRTFQSHLVLTRAAPQGALGGE